MRLRRSLSVFVLSVVGLSMAPGARAQALPSAKPAAPVKPLPLAKNLPIPPADSPLAAESTLPPHRTALIFGQRISYYDSGSGPTLVLVHGFASQARFDWGNVIVPLSKHHRVIALDQIGFGGSDKPFIDYSIQTYVDFLGEFLRNLRVEKFDLAGESLGGWIVANYTMQALAPANDGKYALPKPSHLVLEDAAGHTSLHSVLQRIPIAGNLRDAAGVAIVFYDKSRITPDFVRESFAMKLKANDGMTERLLVGNPETDKEVVGDNLKGISIPTLVVWGGNDELVPLADGKDYAAKIPGAKMVIVPECGHAPSLEKPKEFIDAVTDFLGN